MNFAAISIGKCSGAPETLHTSVLIRDCNESSSKLRQFAVGLVV